MDSCIRVGHVVRLSFSRLKLLFVDNICGYLINML